MTCVMRVDTISSQTLWQSTVQAPQQLSLHQDRLHDSRQFLDSCEKHNIALCAVSFLTLIKQKQLLIIP